MRLTAVTAYAGNSPQALSLGFGNVTLYFSYRTVIGLNSPLTGSVCCQNEWGPTTEKHMKAAGFSDKNARKPYDEFQQVLKQVLDHYDLLLPRMFV